MQIKYLIKFQVFGRGDWQMKLAKSAGAAEYTDCISAEG